MDAINEAISTTLCCWALTTLRRGQMKMYC